MTNAGGLAALALDHVFVMVAPGAPERLRLERTGWQESFRRRHAGQGTRNVCYCLDNAYLELLWEDPEGLDAAGAPGAARMRLRERARWRASGASPFGIAFRAPGPPGAFALEAWQYAPSWLPAGMTIPVAVASDDPAQPLLFRSPAAAPPAAWVDGRAGARQAAAGLARIGGLRLRLPHRAAPADDLRALAAAGLLELGPPGREHQLELLIDGSDGYRGTLRLPSFEWIGA